MWIEPKLEWFPTDFYNFEDLNRVENNTEVVTGLIAHFDAAPILIVVKNRDMKRFEFADSLNRIEGNIDSLRQRFTPAGWINNKLDWQSNTPFNFEDAARLEKNLSLLYFYYSGNYNALPYCGTVTCGEDVI